MNENQQLSLNIDVQPKSTYSHIHDPYWDKLTKDTAIKTSFPDIPNQQEEDDRWNPADFGEVPRKSDSDGQLTIFYEEATEPPDPDDYPTLEDYHRAWADWELSQNSSQDKHGSVILDQDSANAHANISDLVHDSISAPQHTDPVGEQSFKTECVNFDFSSTTSCSVALHPGEQLSLHLEPTVVTLNQEIPTPGANFTSTGLIRNHETAPQHTLVGEQFFSANFESGSFIGVANATTAPQHINTVGEQVSLNTEETTAIPLVGEQVAPTTKKSAPQHEVSHWVEKYWVERGGNKYWYWRYMWMTGRKINRAYLGSARSPIAQQKKQAVQDAIADGQSPQEIKQFLSSFNKKDGWTKMPAMPMPQNL